MPDRGRCDMNQKTTISGIERIGTKDLRHEMATLPEGSAALVEAEEDVAANEEDTEPATPKLRIQRLERPHIARQCL